MSKITVFTIVFISFFGIKYSVLDLRLFFIPLFFLYSSGKLIFIEKFKFYTIILFALTIYSLVLFTITQENPDFMRYLRSLISMTFLPFFLNLYLKKNTIFRIVKIIIGVLSIHLIVMILMYFFPNIQPIIWELYGYNKDLKSMRVTGLTAGFDIAGYFLLCGIILCMNIYLDKNEFRYLILSLLFSVGIFLSSRTNVILLICVLIFFFIKIILKQRRYKILTLTLILSVIFFVIYAFLPLLLLSFGYEIVTESVSKSDIYDKGYSMNNPVEILNSFLVFPNSIAGIIFGTNKIPPSDSGYIQSLNTIGIIGLILIFSFYIRLFIDLCRQEEYISSDRVVIRKITIQILILTLFVTIKNQYMFARGAFELILILFSLSTITHSKRIKV